MSAIQDLQVMKTANEARLLSLGDLLRFAQRRRTTILFVMVTVVLLGVLYCIVGTRRYQAEALIEIRRPDDSLGLNNIVQGTAQAPEVVNPLEENVTLDTKVAELKSDTLILKVVNELHLEGTADFKPMITLNPLSYVSELFLPPARKDPPRATLMESPVRRAKAIRTFTKHLKVEVISGTRLISIKYANPDPALAAAVVNSLANNLEQYGFQTKFETTQQLATWLGDQLESVRQQAVELQQKEAGLRRGTESYDIGGTNSAGQSVVYSPVLDHLQQSTAALAQAESNRILRAAVNQIVQTRDPKLISGLAGSGLLGSGNPQSTTSLELIQGLQTQEAQQEIALSQDELRYGDAYPKLIEERAQLHSIQQTLKDETSRLSERAANDYLIADKQEQRTRIEHDELLRHASDVNDKFLQYKIIHQEAQDAQQFYTDLSRRLREAGVTAGLRSADTSIFSPGLAPDRPSSPKFPLVLALTPLVGALMGLTLAGIQEVWNDKVNSIESVESEIGIPLFGIVPEFKLAKPRPSVNRVLRSGFGYQEKESTSFQLAPQEEKVQQHRIQVLTDPESPYTEALRALRTSIVLSNSADLHKTIFITSSTPCEGKSTTSLNLATTFARAGARTLLVEVDLRNPVLANRLGLSNPADGLSRVLDGRLPDDWAIPVCAVAKLYCIPAGQGSSEPLDLITSDRTKTLIKSWQSDYQIVILDGPPVLPVVDSLFLSEYSDLVLLITRFGKTNINALRRAHRLLSRQVDLNIGAVLNAVSTKAEGYHEYCGYRSNA
jgi:succinoglycan biosynthesis transport protein ExoP